MMGRTTMPKLEINTKNKNMTKKNTNCRHISFPNSQSHSRKRRVKIPDAFEQWVWREILKVLWKERKSNIKILQNVRPNTSLEALTKC